VNVVAVTGKTSPQVQNKLMFSALIAEPPNVNDLPQISGPAAGGDSIGRLAVRVTLDTSVLQSQEHL